MATNNSSLGNVINIAPNSGDSHQTSPAWMLTVLSFENPATNQPLPNETSLPPVSKPDQKKKWGSQSYSNATNTKDTMVITSDCISLSIDGDKSNPVGSFSATLVGGRFNYLARINNGDYVIVNIRDYETEMFDTNNSDSLYNRAVNGQAINRANDGFKGVYKITSVREQVSSLPNGGQRVVYQIRGQSFTEFNNVVYFNPYIAQSLSKGNILYYKQNISADWQSSVAIEMDLQGIVSRLLGLIIGSGPNRKTSNQNLTPEQKKKINNADVRAGGNQSFLIPKNLGGLLGSPSSTTFNTLYRMMLGIQTYSTSLVKKNNQDLDLYQPVNLDTENKNNYYQTKRRISGRTVIRPEYWSQTTGWSILTSYANSPINEMFTTFRLSPEGSVMPFFVFRQIPFSSNGFVKKQGGTRFLSLPRWKIDSSMVKEVNIGREDNARFNFVQVFGLPFGWVPNAQQTYVAAQVASDKNLVLDSSDISRSGLRPYVLSNALDYPSENAKGGAIFQTPYWASLLGDALIGGHMKLNGMIACAGLEEDIAVGDNLEYNGLVFHIEGIRHECKVEANGGKSFTTILKLTHGVDASENDDFTVYGETINKSYQAAAEADPTLPHIVSEGDVSTGQEQDPNAIVELNPKLSGAFNRGGA